MVKELGLGRTRVVGGPRQLLESMLADVGARDGAEFARIYPTLPEAQVRSLRVLDPAHTTASTARDVTRLLERIWRDEAGPPAWPSTICAHADAGGDFAGGPNRNGAVLRS